jgi:riboflavin synthase
MFTGIVEEVGELESFERLDAGARMRVRCKGVVSDATEGSSIAVNGVCLTALDVTPAGFSADLAPETLHRTNLGDLSVGSLVNLERPLLATGRLSGHVVQGHVDGTAEFLGLEELGAENWWLRVRVTPELERYLVFKGSVALDGISLTVAALEGDILSIAIIPHTYQATALRTLSPGARVNLECDIFAKYAEKWFLTSSLAPVAFGTPSEGS